MPTPSIIVLRPSADARAAGYDIRLGPLRFVTPADAVGEPVGDGLDTVGAALTASDRRPRALKLKLPVRGADNESDATETGRQLRRNVRELLDNAQWRLQGFFFTWEADPDLDGWLMVGGADLTETDPGITFGEFEMDFSDVYIVGRPGTHRPGRRAVIGDRRTGLVARDTRRLLYSSDFEDHDLPAEPLAVPGDIVDLVTSGNRPVSSIVDGPIVLGRRLWRSVSAADGEALSYLPDGTALPDRDRYIAIDEAGGVRVWDLSQASVYPPAAGAYSTGADVSPDTGYGWRRVLGDVLSPDRPLAIDNGACRLIWLGSAPNKGLALEYWDDALGHFRRHGRILHATGVHEQRVIEATHERVVVEWRGGQHAMRAVLQRGWWGPRLESYADGGGDARLEFAPDLGDEAIVTPQAPVWVNEVTTDDPDQPALLWASGSTDETVDTDPVVISGPAAGWTHSRVLVGQLAPPGPSAAALASLSLADARPVPVLVGRR